MVTGLFRKIFGSRNERVLKKLGKVVDKINSYEEQFIALKDQEFPLRTETFKDRLKQGENLDDLLPEAFALVREAGKRVLGERHFDMQLVGGMPSGPSAAANSSPSLVISQIVSCSTAMPSKSACSTGSPSANDLMIRPCW